MSRVSSRQALILVSLLTLSIALVGCGSSSKLKEVGKTPALSNIGDPTAEPGYKPVTLPMPAPEPAVYTANSLWRSNDQSFFRDDEAEFENSTDRSRTSGRGLGVGTGVLGSLFSLIPGITDANAIVSANATTNTNGDGSIERSEQLETTIAAVIVQKLPNGNLVIEGKQEVRVNFEVRELIVAGIIRPDDIQPDNTIESTKIAQARISYGGRGHITQVQQPGYGQQIVDIVSPF